MRDGREQQARELYGRAADAEQRALADLDPKEGPNVWDIVG